MADAIEQLKEDHRRVEQLFDRFEQSGDASVAIELCQELTVHAALEEELVYPILADVDPDLEREGEKEHDEARQLVIEIQTAGEGADISDTVRKLRAAVEHHVEEEEGEAFPKLEASAADKVAGLGETLAQRKQELFAQLDKDPTLAADDLG